MAKDRVGAPSINAAVAALRFFFKVTLERPDLVRHLTTVQEPRKAPIVLNQEEVTRLLEAAPGLKYKAALCVAYGAGLRVSEVANLKVSDIDSERMTLRVEPGKASRRAHRPHRRAAHLGFGAQPSSACSRHRSRWRP